MPLSDVYLRKLKKGDKAKHHDEGGLYLFLSPAGGKLWRMDYTFEGKRKTLSVGKYPAVGLKEARARRDAAKTMIATGIDPSAEKKRVKVQAAIEEREQALTFEAVARDWFSKNARHGRKATRRKSFPGLRTSFSPISGTNKFPP
ncbi:MAG: Arm DNA-binding domain-containing protein [Bilophila wadsworthia]